ncbi:MAG: CO dehydrogenase/acetyl-CoA synthase complex subunit alpha [Candidatus Altiarchaeota archaeon]|nr:CO dehydrogenase/acetyl-CoA synthase complex subunit alpha [Candidatus Altiarchaeota archaeon]
MRHKINEVNTLISSGIRVKGKNVRVSIGAGVKEKRIRMPGISDLRDWDRILLSRYNPQYTAICDKCSLCTLGPCDLSRGRRGACGMDLVTQQSRFALLLGILGASTHTAHAREMVDRVIEKFGRYTKIDMGGDIDVDLPLFRLIMGKKPRNVRSLLPGLEYIERELNSLVSSLSFGQESSNMDFESKLLHSGMLDSLGMEIADVAQISALGFPKADPKSPLVEIGFGIADTSKPVVLCLGHNVCSGVEIVDYIAESKSKVEVVGICCTAHDLARYSSNATKIIGPLSHQLPYVKAGIADVIVLDEQCIRVDTIENAKNMGIPVITTSDKNIGGLPDLSNDDVNEIVKKLVDKIIPGAYIHDLDKLGEIVVKTATGVHKNKKKIPAQKEDYIKEIEKCRALNRTGKGSCSRACPVNIDVSETLKLIREGKLKKAKEAIHKCLFCGRCESHCPEKIPVIQIFSQVIMDDLLNQRGFIRPGRGPISDVEIRKVGRPIVFGEIPGIILFAGCPNYSEGSAGLVEMAETFLDRKYIVTATGCSAMDLALSDKKLYEKYPGDFDAGCLVNTGSCVSNSHILDAAIKIANIFAKRPLEGNYEEIADYILNRVGAVAVAWGAMSQKAHSIVTGANRLGIPVVLGPQGVKYRRSLLSSEETSWSVYDTRSGEKCDVGPVPEHLYYIAETKEDAITVIPKLCMRASDGVKGRQIKIAHYIDLYEKQFDKLPEDFHRFIRQESDIPLTLRNRLLPILKKKGWKPAEKIPDPTLLDRKR